MKKLILVLFLLAFTLGSFAQQVKDNSVVVRGGTSTDKAIKNQTVSQIFLGTPYIQTMQFEIKTARLDTTPYQKARVFIEKSYNTANWYTVDTLLIATTDSVKYSISDLQTINMPYARLRLVPYDSTQTINYKYSTTIKIQ